jgi:hypothetical protein
MTKAWVIGSNGLLGSAFLNVLRHGEINLFIHNECFCWDSESVLCVQLEAAVKSLLWTKKIAGKYTGQQV